MPGGRPTLYRPEYAEQAKKLCLLGADDKALADFFGVQVSTLSLWKNAYPEFMEALKLGKDELDSKVVQSLFRRAMGYSCPEDKVLTKDGKHTGTVRVTRHYPPDVTAMIFWLKNRQPDAWRDKRELDVNKTDTSRMTDAEIERLILTGSKAKKEKEQRVRH